MNNITIKVPSDGTEAQQTTKVQPQDLSAKIATNAMLAAGFRYDREDNVWYDENPNRDKWYYRIEKNRNDNYWQLFGGGFTNKIAQSLDVSYLINTYVK